MSRLAIYLHATSAMLLLGAGFVFAARGHQFVASACFVASTVLPMWVGDRTTARWKA